MCGRYASFRQAQDVADDFTLTVIDPVAEELGPSWNVAPTQNVAVVLESLVGPEGERVEDEDADAPGVTAVRRLTVARWGLVPHWAKDPGVGNRMINARSETAAEKPSFRHAVRRRRCVVRADWYYEWRASAEGRTAKTPFAIGRADGEPIAFAGLYSWWKVPDIEEAGADAGKGAGDLAVHDGGWLLTCTILTKAAEGAMREIHDRVPVVLEPDAVDAWLDPRLEDAAQVADLWAAPTPYLRWHEVSRAVNTPRNNTPDLVEPVDGAEEGEG